MSGEIPTEFHIVLSKEHAEITLCTLWAAAEMTQGRRAQSILDAADALRDQIGLSGFKVTPAAAAPTPRRKGAWRR
jgi:hypothetical protein